MKTIAFAASSSKNSINKKLVAFVLSELKSEDKTLLDLNDYPLPIYSIDEENERGIPQNVHNFGAQIDAADLVIISLAEHNGSYTAVFKNLFDWLSRREVKCFEGKMILLSTSPGPRGGQSVMDAALDRFPRHGAEIIGHLSVPNFHDHFSDSNELKNLELKIKWRSILEKIA